MRARRVLSIVGLTLWASVWISPVEAGFFDEFGEMFGGRQRSYEPDPMYIKVYPRRARVRPRGARRQAPKPELASKVTDAVKAATIDPVKDPQWFLHDPTLRRGDIVVLEGRVLVYDSSPSRDGHDREDFVSLNEAKGVPKATRQLVHKLTSGPSSAQKIAGAE